LLLYAAVQFIVLSVVAMQLYAGGTWYHPHARGYQFFHNFLSDLGTTRTFSGRANWTSCVLFSIALVTVGAALVLFAGAWRGFAYGREQARRAGIAAQIFGVMSGLAFAGVGLTPFDRYMWPHNTLVICAFGLLLCYVVCISLLLIRNRSGAVMIGANLAYLAVVLGYLVLILGGPRLGTEHGHTVQVTGQKIIVYTSMVYVIFLTLATRRRAGDRMVELPDAAVPGAPASRARAR
jgi:hypothetical membrane protein